jgi:hypothetical protein
MWTLGKASFVSHFGNPANIINKRTKVLMQELTLHKVPAVVSSDPPAPIANADPEDSLVTDST